MESVGGVRSPLAVDGDTVTLVTELRPALVVLVADAELGTINVVRLSVDVLISHRVVVYLNRYDTDNEMHVRNHDWLATRDGPRSRRRSRGTRRDRRDPQVISASRPIVSPGTSATFCTASTTPGMKQERS